jgi:hypothetical protein
MDTWRRSKRIRAQWLVPLGFFLGAVLSGCTGGCGDRLEPQGEPAALIRRVARSPEATPMGVDIDDERALFLVAGMRGPIQVWSEAGSEPAGVSSLPAPGVVLAARFLRGGVLVALEQGAVTLYGDNGQRVLFSHDFTHGGRQAALSADGRYVALGGSVVELASNREVGDAKLLASQSGLAFSANGERVVSAGFQEPWIEVRDLRVVPCANGSRRARCRTRR